MAKYYDRCWNPIFGCNGSFKGCDHCFAKSLMERRGRDWTDFSCMRINKKQLYRRFDAKSQLVAVCTQSDLFQGENGANQWLVDAVLKKCNANLQNRYLILTKFSKNMRDYFDDDDDVVKRLGGDHLVPLGFDHIAFGVSVCCNEDLHRLDDLRAIPAQYRFVAFEPLLEHIDLNPRKDLELIDWVVIGAETGENPRECIQEWMIDMVERIKGYKTHFYPNGLPVFVNAVHTEDGKVTTEFNEMDERLRLCENPFAITPDNVAVYVK